MSRLTWVLVGGAVLYVMWAKKWPPALWTALHGQLDHGSTVRAS